MFKSHRRRTFKILAAVASVLAVGASLAVVPAVPAGATTAPAPPFTECPAIGASPSCEILLVVNTDNTVSVIGDPSVGPFDGNDDTLVGIINDSTSAVDAVTVSGPGSDLSGFDGDGICSGDYGTWNGSAGCPYGPTGYEGPGTSFVTDPSLPDSAEIDFTGGLAPGKSAYFSLEGALTSAELTAREGGLTCGDNASKYRTTVSENAGVVLALPELFTDTVTADWCTDGKGHFQILSSSQNPAVRQEGYTSPSSIELKVLSGFGITFGVTPATAPVPTIENEDTVASAIASGLSFNGQLNAGALLVSIATGFVTKRLAAELVLLIRGGHLGAGAIELLHWYGQQVARGISWLRSRYVPDLVARWLTGKPLNALQGELQGLAEKFVATVTQTLEALNTNVTVGNVIDAIKSAIQQVTSALTFTRPLWQPEITVTIDGAAEPVVSNTGTQKAFFIHVDDPHEATTPTN